MSPPWIFQQYRNEGCLSYFLGDPESREGIWIDPKQEDLQRYIQFLKEGDWRLRYVIDTHTHADHISSSCALAGAVGAKVVMSEKTGSERLEIPVREGTVLRAGSMDLKFIETPGHTRDSVCMETDPYLFTGDTLLFEDCGRTDLPGGDPETLYDSIVLKIARYPNETIIAPAHDYEDRKVMTLGDVRKVNAVLKFGSKEEFVAYLKSWHLGLPKRLEESLTTNQHHCMKLG